MELPVCSRNSLRGPAGRMNPADGPPHRLSRSATPHANAYTSPLAGSQPVQLYPPCADRPCRQAGAHHSGSHHARVATVAQSWRPL